MFDLIILKADSNETLFDVVQDEIHSNIYGYVVARVGADFKTAELLGYFLSKDFNKTVLGKNINVSELKPINNFEDIKWLLENTENLEYIEMQDFNKCCGLNGISKVKEFKITSKIFEAKRNNIKQSGVKFVTTSCLGCEIALSSYSFGQYKVKDLIEFISNRV